MALQFTSLRVVLGIGPGRSPFCGHGERSIEVNPVEAGTPGPSLFFGGLAFGGEVDFAFVAIQVVFDISL